MANSKLTLIQSTVLNIAQDLNSWRPQSLAEQTQQLIWRSLVTREFFFSLVILMFLISPTASRLNAHILQISVHSFIPREYQLSFYFLPEFLARSSSITSFFYSTYVNPFFISSRFWDFLPLYIRNLPLQPSSLSDPMTPSGITDSIITLPSSQLLPAARTHPTHPPHLL